MIDKPSYRRYTVSMEERLFLAEFGTKLWTREYAKEVKFHLIKLLDKLDVGKAVVLDAEGVEVWDVSFPGELIVKTVLNMARDYPGRFLIIENLSPYARENLIAALNRDGAVIIERKGRKLQLIGKVHPADQSTFDAVVEAKGPSTAAALKERLKVNLTAMNERLSKLTSLGLIRREKSVSVAGREQYEYWAPI